MPFAEHYMAQGTFTVPSSLPATVNVNCGFIPTKVELIDKTALLSMSGGPPLANPGATYLTYRAVWNNDFGSALTLLEGITASALTSSIQPITSNGISAYDGHAASPNQLVLGTKITGSNTAKATGTFTVTSTATLYAGATILMTGNTVNKQLGGMFFTINTIASTTTFTIANAGWLNTSNFTNGAETFSVQLVTTPALYQPQQAQIVSITAANPAVITTSTNMNVAVGQQVRLYVPKVFGMTQANFTTGVVSAVSGNQITLGGANLFGVSNGLNTTGFTAFAWPAATSVPFSPATVVPIGSGPYPNTLNYYNQDTLEDATLNTAFQGFTVGTNVLATASSTVFGVTASDVISWTAWRGDV